PPRPPTPAPRPRGGGWWGGGREGREESGRRGGREPAAGWGGDGPAGAGPGVGGGGASSSRGARPAPLRAPARPTQPLEPILIPKLRIRLADFPYLHCSNMPEAVHLGDLLRIWVRPGARFTPSPPDFQGPSPVPSERRSPISQDRLTHVQLLFTWNPSPLRPSKFSFEYLLLPPRSAPAAAPPGPAP
uniref:Uncharacterized protein n=1 Tax=Ovis aries TaxID=9940 RepID=A0AC11D439_SHEEP